MSNVCALALSGLSSEALANWLHASSTKHIEQVVHRWLDDLFVEAVATSLLDLLQAIDRPRLQQVLLPMPQGWPR